MTRVALVLRPEPGATETAARLGARGITIRRCPLFVVRRRSWVPPDPAAYDALIVTSANAIRHGGEGLAALTALPLCAVGQATALEAARAGFDIAHVGIADAAALVTAARARGWHRLLHLAGQDRRDIPGLDAVVVYGSDPLTLTTRAVADWPGSVALLHSPRAAARFAALVGEAGLDRRSIGVAAISRATADAAGGGWAARAVATAPRDDALVSAAAALIDRWK